MKEPSGIGEERMSAGVERAGADTIFAGEGKEAERSRRKGEGNEETAATWLGSSSAVCALIHILFGYCEFCTKLFS